VTLEYIIVKGARQHNLNVDELRIPKQRLVVFTGVSGSGKSSMAFDTLFAEGQRRYVESLSSYARQFLGQMERPQYEHIRGLSPTVAIEQKSAASNPRSTVGTITEIHDYLRVLYARVGEAWCPRCEVPVRAMPLDRIVEDIATQRGPSLLLAPLAEQRKGRFEPLLADLEKRGFVRVLLDGAVVRLDSKPALDPKRKHDVHLVVDRFDPALVEPSRLRDSVEGALREGGGTVLLRSERGGHERRYSRDRTCPKCRQAVPEPTPQSMSFNSPLGMCPACNGLGKVASMDPRLLIPDESLSLSEGAIAPFAQVLQRGQGLSFGMFDAVAREFGIDLQRPWRKLSRRHQALLLHGTGDRRVTVQWQGSHGQVSWPMQFEGVVPLLLRRYRETHSEAMRRYYSDFLSEETCPECDGARLRPESRAVRVGGSPWSSWNAGRSGNAVTISMV